jgi:hypothetical protein
LLINLVFWKNGNMKTTIDLPDELVTEIKIEAARQKKKLKELVPELVRAGLSARRMAGPAEVQAVEQWLDEWVQLGKAATRGRPARPTATEILAADRGRLEER